MVRAGDQLARRGDLGAPPSGSARGVSRERIRVQDGRAGLRTGKPPRGPPRAPLVYRGTRIGVEATRRVRRVGLQRRHSRTYRVDPPNDPAQRPGPNPWSRGPRRRRLGRHQVPAGVLLQPRVLAVPARGLAEHAVRGAGRRALLDRHRRRRGHRGVHQGQGTRPGRVRGRRPTGHRGKERGKVRRGCRGYAEGTKRIEAAHELETNPRGARALAGWVHHRVPRARRGVRA